MCYWNYIIEELIRLHHHHHHTHIHNTSGAHLQSNLIGVQSNEPKGNIRKIALTKEDTHTRERDRYIRLSIRFGIHESIITHNDKIRHALHSIWCEQQQKGKRGKNRLKSCTNTNAHCNFKLCKVFFFFLSLCAKMMKTFGNVRRVINRVNKRTSRFSCKKHSLWPSESMMMPS